MKRVWKHLVRRRADVAAHPFFVWIDSETVPLEQRFVFTPVMIDFIMGFADMNKWFLSYAEPSNALERSINDHTVEDRTHSRLFYHNWYALELGDPSSWGAGKALWWLFESSDSAAVRRFGMDILDLAVNYPNPNVRFSMMEAIEICGDVFFGHTAPIATALQAKTGVRHHYYGEYHRARETGHLHADERVFLEKALTDGELADAARAIDRVFDNFLGVLDKILSYGQAAAADSSLLAATLEGEYASRLASPPPMKAAGAVSRSQVPLTRHLARRKERLRRHPFLDWLREDDTVADAEKLRRFVALWGVDIVGYQDFNELVLRYRTPQSPAEHAINRWTADLATHGALYLQDWKALEMDRVLGWDMGETIAFYFLGEQTEVHRRNMAKVKKLAFANPKPVLRHWLLTSLEASGDPLFECTRPVALAAEAEGGITLHYWANRHAAAHAPRTLLDATHDFGAEELSADEVTLVTAMIDTVFDNIEEQFSLSHQEALRGVFFEEPASLPPPRLSEIVLRAAQSSETASNSSELQVG